MKATAPKGLIEDIVVDAMRADGADFDDLKEFRDDFDDEYDDMIDLLFTIMSRRAYRRKRK